MNSTGPDIHLYLSERHASHHGAIRRCHGVSCRPRAGGSGERGPDSEGEARFWLLKGGLKGGLCNLLACLAGERSWRRRAPAEDRPVVYLHLLHSSPAQPGRVPGCSSGQWCRHSKAKATDSKVTSPPCCPRLATDTASPSLDCTRATFRAT